MLLFQLLTFFFILHFSIKKNYAHICVYLHNGTVKKNVIVSIEKPDSEGTQWGIASRWSRLVQSRVEEAVGSDGGDMCIGTYKLKPGWYNDDDNKATFNGWSFSTLSGSVSLISGYHGTLLTFHSHRYTFWRDNFNYVHFVEGYFLWVAEVNKSLRLDHCPLRSKLLCRKSSRHSLHFGM